MEALNAQYSARCARIVEAGSEEALDAAEFLEGQMRTYSTQRCREDYAYRYVRKGNFGDDVPPWACQFGSVHVSDDEQPRLKGYFERRHPDMRIHCDKKGYCSAVPRPEPLFKEHE